MTRSAIGIKSLHQHRRYKMKTEQILADLTAELKADNDAAELKEAIRLINERYINSLVYKIANATPTVCFDRVNDRIGLTQNGKTKF